MDIQTNIIQNEERGGELIHNSYCDNSLSVNCEGYTHMNYYSAETTEPTTTLENNNHDITNGDENEDEINYLSRGGQLMKTVRSQFLLTPNNERKCKNCETTYHKSTGSTNLKRHIVLKHPEVMYGSEYIVKTPTKTPHIYDVDLNFMDGVDGDKQFHKRYIVSNQEKTYRVCVFCKKNFSLKTAPSNLKRHLIKSHPNEIDFIPCTVEPTTMNNKKLDDTQEQILNKLLLKFFVKNYVPLEVADSPTFVSLIKFCNNTIKTDCKDAMVEKLEELYLKAKCKLQNYLHDSINKVSLTIDIWSNDDSEHQTSSYLLIMVHFIDPTFEYRTLLLDLNEIPLDPTSEDISELILSTLIDFSLNSKVISVTYNNSNLMESSMESLSKNLEDSNIHFIVCTMHALNAIVLGGLNMLDNKALVKIRDAMDKGYKNPAMMNFYKSLTDERVPKEVPTEWDNTYLMLKMVNKNIHEFATITKSFLQDFNISIEETNFLYNLEKFIQPFYDVKKELNQQQPQTLGLNFLLLENLKDVLLEAKYKNCEEDIRKCSEVMLEICEHYIAKMTSFNTYVSAFLDPRIKRDALSKSLNTPENFDNLGKLCSSKYGLKNVEREEISFTEQILAKKRKSLGIGSLDEISSYLCDSHLKFDDNILEWWSLHKNRFPSLSCMSKDYLCQQPTTVSAKEILSKIEFSLTDWRNDMNDDTVKQIIIFNNWDEHFSKELWDDHNT